MFLKIQVTFLELTIFLNIKRIKTHNYLLKKILLVEKEEHILSSKDY
jgi:hypothetical protein